MRSDRHKLTAIVDQSLMRRVKSTAAIAGMSVRQAVEIGLAMWLDSVEQENVARRAEIAATSHRRDSSSITPEDKQKRSCPQPTTKIPHSPPSQKGRP